MHWLFILDSRVVVPRYPENKDTFFKNVADTAFDEEVSRIKD